MDLKSLDIEELITRVRIVEAKLSSEKMTNELLDEAFDHFPAIATLYVWISKIATSRKRNTPEYKELLKIMERDFLVLLALWDIEKDEKRKLSLRFLGEAEKSRRTN